MAQRSGVDVHGLLVTHTEVSEQRRSRGIGIGATANLDLGPWRLELGAQRAPLNSGADTTASFTLTTIDARLGWALRPWLIVEAGGGRRNADPIEVAEDYGFASVGLRFETSLASISRMWVRGGVLPIVRFSGGGDAGTAVEIGFGVSVGSPAGKLSGRVEYDMQRVGRTVAGLNAPILLEMARVGLVVHPF